MAPSPKTPPSEDESIGTDRPSGRIVAKQENDDTQFMPMAPAVQAGMKSSPSKSTPRPTEQSGPNSELDEGMDVILGEFRLLRRLGRGGMAEVYLAEQTLLKRHVAIKVMRPELTLDETLRQRFQKEALAVAGLNHPNIVQVYTVGEANGKFFIAQEYINGQNLREYLTRKGPPELSVALIVMKQVAAALQAAAQAGIVHRDIKPENIMLGRKGDVKVTDFGLAKRGQTADSQQLTQLGTTMGTPLYMSPEQVSGKSVDQRSDLYSYGVTCYHMLAGQPPFRGESAIAIAMQHLKDAAPSLEKLRPDLPPLLCRIVHKCMEKNPDARYQSAGSVIKDLKRITQDKNSGANSHPTSDRPPSAVVRIPIISRIQSALRNPTAQAIQLADLPARQQLKRFAVIAIPVLLLFAGIGWIRRPVDPMLTRQPANRVVNAIPKKETAEEQYYYASTRRHDIAAWEAVPANFPNDKIFTPAALIELGIKHLAERRPNNALKCFDQLVAYGEIERQWQTAGWAGQAAVLSQQGDYSGSQKLLLEKVADRRKDLPRRMLPIATSTLDSNSRRMNRGTDTEIRRIFEDPNARPVPQD